MAQHQQLSGHEGGRGQRGDGPVLVLAGQADRGDAADEEDQRAA
jgi:hypothetical protein